MTAPKLAAVALGLLALVTAPACDLGGMSDAPAPATCSAIGARCQRPDGPIGVCQQTTCTGGEEPPCWVCTPQH